MIKSYTDVDEVSKPQTNGRGYHWKIITENIYSSQGSPADDFWSVMLVWQIYVCQFDDEMKLDYAKKVMINDGIKLGKFSYILINGLA